MDTNRSASIEFEPLELDSNVNISKPKNSRKKIPGSKAKAKSPKHTRFELPKEDYAPFSDSAVSVTPQSDVEKLIEDTRKRIQKRQLEIYLQLESLKNEFKNDISVTKALKLKEGSFLGEYYFKKYVTITSTGKVKINKNLRAEDFMPMPVNAYDNQINFNEEEVLECIENLARTELCEFKDLEECKFFEIEENLEEKKMLFEETIEEEDIPEIGENPQVKKMLFEETIEEEDIPEIGENPQVKKMAEIEDNQEDKKMDEIKENMSEFGENREGEKMPEIEETREEKKMSEFGKNREGEKMPEIEENREEKKMSEFEEEQGDEKMPEEEKTFEIEENREEEKTFEIEENREEEKMLDIVQSQEEAKMLDTVQSQEEAKMLDIVQSREEAKMLDTVQNQEEEGIPEIEETREEEGIPEIEENREVDKMQELVENRCDEKMHDIEVYREVEKMPESEENRDKEKITENEENREDDNIPENVEFRVEEKISETVTLQEQTLNIENDIADDMIQRLIEELRFLKIIKNHVDQTQSPKVLDSSDSSEPEKSKDVKMLDEILNHVKETLQTQVRAQDPAFKASEEQGNRSYYHQLIKLHNMLKEYKSVMESLRQQNNNPDEIIVPETTPVPVIPSATAFGENNEIKVKVRTKKLPVQHRLIIIVDDIKTDGIEEGRPSPSPPISIIQRKDTSIHTSTDFDNSTLCETLSSHQLAGDASPCSSYHTAFFEGDDSRVNIDFTEAPAPTEEMQPSTSSKRSFKEFIQSIYGITYEMESGKAGQTVKKSAREQNKSFLGSNKSIGAFMYPISGQLFEMEDDY